MKDHLSFHSLFFCCFMFSILLFSSCVSRYSILYIDTIWCCCSTDSLIVVVHNIKDFSVSHFFISTYSFTIYYLWEACTWLITLKCVNIACICCFYFLLIHHHVCLYNYWQNRFMQAQVFPQKALNKSLQAVVSTNFVLPLSFKCLLILLGAAHWSTVCCW